MTLFRTWLLCSLDLRLLFCFVRGHGALRRNYPRWPAGLGNHRCRVQVAEKADAVWVHIPWRRRDPAPRKRTSWSSMPRGRPCPTASPCAVNREFGDVVFQADAPGEYFVYYMPFSEKTVDWSYSMRVRGAAVHRRSGLARAERPDAERLRDGRWRALPKAKVGGVPDVERVPPLRSDGGHCHGRGDEGSCGEARRPLYLLFPEDRKFPIRMSDDLPLRWIRQRPGRRVPRRGLPRRVLCLSSGRFRRQAGRSATWRSRSATCGAGDRAASAVIPAASFPRLQLPRHRLAGPADQEASRRAPGEGGRPFGSASRFPATRRRAVPGHAYLPSARRRSQAPCGSP